MTTKERVLRAMAALPDDATLADAMEELRRLEGAGRGGGADAGAAPGAEVRLARPIPPGEPGGDAWDLLGSLTGAVSAPADWAAEHDHYLYGAPKRSDAA